MKKRSDEAFIWTGVEGEGEEDFDPESMAISSSSSTETSSKPSEKGDVLTINSEVLSGKILKYKKTSNELTGKTLVKIEFEL